MKALVLTAKENMSLQELPTPTITDQEVLLKVKYCGVCGTDVHIFHGEPGSAEVTPPIVLGHEFSGEVIEVGAEVTTLAVGDHVAVDPNIYCGKCRYCRDGRVQLCDNLSAVGVTRNGGMAEFCNVPETACLKISQELPFEIGAMVEPLSCVLHGFDQIAPITADKKVLVIGAGFIGSLFLQMVQQKGAIWVDACEPNQQKHQLLTEMGVKNIFADLGDITDSYDLIIECVGKKQTCEKAVELANKGAELLFFGVPSPGTKIEISAHAIFQKELKIVGSFINPFTLNEAVDLLNSGAIDVKSLLSHQLTLAEVPDLLADYGKYGVTKAIIRL
ncbi:zinc-dependent alcohol dehydrogenase family protein [Enterococcus sp. LJL120]